MGIWFFPPKEYMYGHYKSATVSSAFFLSTPDSIMWKFRLIQAKVGGRRSKLPGTFVRQVLKYRRSAVRGRIMCRFGLIFT